MHSISVSSTSHLLWVAVVSCVGICFASAVVRTHAEVGSKKKSLNGKESRALATATDLTTSDTAGNASTKTVVCGFTVEANTQAK